MVDPSLYNPISMPNKYDYLKAAGDEAYNREKAERSARGSGIGSIIGTVLGAASFSNTWRWSSSWIRHYGSGWIRWWSMGWINRRTPS
jgi:hypothetical protein